MKDFFYLFFTDHEFFAQHFLHVFVASITLFCLFIFALAIIFL